MAVWHTDALAEVYTYFRLDSDLNALEKTWTTGKSKLNKRLAVAVKQIPGLRILKQESVETLFSFIISQNNNIKRIQGLVEALCEKYGDLVATIDGEEFYDFPTVETLSNASEEELRDLGMGYRAKYIPEAARYIVECGGKKWLDDMPEKDVDEVRTELIKIKGIGPKVADCVTLFGMSKLDRVPVDTHVYQIAKRYMSLPGKSPTKAQYSEITEYFKKHLGEYCGWAVEVLFASELRGGEDKTPEKNTSPKRKSSSPTTQKLKKRRTKKE